MTTGGDPQMILEDVSGQVVRTLSYQAEFDGSPREMCLYYTTAVGEPSSQDRRGFPGVSADGTSGYTLPRKNIVSLRLDPCSPGAGGDAASVLCMEAGRAAPPGRLSCGPDLFSCGVR